MKNRIKIFLLIFLILKFSWSMAQQIINEQAEVLTHYLKDDGTFPNNEKIPLTVYKNVIDLSSGNPASIVEEVFDQNNWGNSWRNGIYSYHHYHSTAHEVLGIYSGTAKVQLGGPEGVKLNVEAGDVIIIPAGVAHKNLGSSNDFACVGAYPPGQNFDMNYGKEGERPKADNNIKKMPDPANDPVFGEESPFIKSIK